MSAAVGAGTRARAGLAVRLEAFAKALREAHVPRAAPRRELAVAGHVAARAWASRGAPYALRRALVDLAFIEGALLAFGRGAMIADGGAFFLPDYHGPHFHRALRRLLVPGEGPFVAHLSMTGACPWQCRYCFASAGGAGAPDVGDRALARIAEALVKERVPIVILGGGEPLGRFERTLALVATLSRASEVRLATSGSGLTPSRAEALRAAGLRVLAISLDSNDRARVDAARGDGAFAVAVRALRVAAGAGIETLVTCVVGRGSFAREGELEGLLALVRSVHPRAVVNFIPEFATGRGEGDGFRTPAEYAPTGARLARAIREGAHRAAAFYSPPMDRLVGCVGAGQRQVVIDTRANLCACVSGASFGNLLDEPFDVVWARMLAAPSRLKQGYFCAQVHERDEPLPRGEDAMRRALEGFHEASPDAVLQRVIDALGPALARLVPG